jgi:hypothetical protein
MDTFTAPVPDHWEAVLTPEMRAAVDRVMAQATLR